jgi:hypothetical protein
MGKVLHGIGGRMNSSNDCATLLTLEAWATFVSA